MAEGKRAAAAAGKMLGALAAMAPGTASAGAWMAEGGEAIFTLAAGAADGDSLLEASAYLESDGADGLALVAAPWLRSETGDNEARAEAVLGVKAELARSDRGALAVQMGAAWRSDAPSGCADAGAELRAMAGLSFGPAGRGFVNAEAAGRVSQGECTLGRYELSVGYRPDEHWLGVAQVFVDDARYDEGVNAQLSLVRFGDSGRGLQIGLRARVDGDDAEPALVLGFWGARR